MWSAGCSTGEEPYTLAMVASEFLEERHLKPEGWNCHITCSDISLESLFIAKEGKFPLKSVQKIDEKHLIKYFDKLDDHYMVKEDLKKMTRFDFHNLIYDNGIRDVDVVFCRNVLIYFDTDIQKKVVANIYDTLKPEGFLFIGHSESLIGLFDGFKPETFEKGIVYVKK
jgi:chemotaxis protein methyltransferase CheR